MTVDICVVTYNRLPYLQKCIWALLATKPKNWRLFVGDDCSTDGSAEWLIGMQKRGKIYKAIINETNLGSFVNHNNIIRVTETEWFTMVLTDFYVHRGWDDACLRVINEYNDCGIVSFYQNARIFIDEHEHIKDDVYKVKRSGLGAAIINRELFEKAGGFPTLNNDKKWGYKATPFCYTANSVEIQRNVHYQIMPHFASDMDKPQSPLNDIDILDEYCKNRHFHKYNK